MHRKEDEQATSKNKRTDARGGNAAGVGMGWDGKGSKGEKGGMEGHLSST